MMIETTARTTFETVARDLTTPIRRYLERYVGNGTVAEDLCQETLLRIQRGLPCFEGRSSVKTWAFSIASRVAADYLRAPERNRRIVDMDAVEDLEAPDVAMEDRLVVDEMNACVRQVIDTLPEPYRAALVLHDIEGFSAVETAEICGSSEATAKIRIHRARLRLKEALKRECEFYRDGESVLRCDRRDGSQA